MKIDKNFTFVDLFSGIGGFRIALEKLNGKCVFSSEIDKFSRKTYEINFHDMPTDDIMKIDEKNIPDHDILCAGFPCQSFSIAGLQKGFQDERGNLFFKIINIVKEKKSKIFILENVKNLIYHDNGKTFEIIKNSFIENGYKIFWKIVDAINFVPQHRERIIIIGIRNELAFDFLFPEFNKKDIIISNILDKNILEKYTLSNNMWIWLQNHAEKHKNMGNGFKFGLIDPEIDKFSRTLSSRYYKDGSEILIKQKNNNPRRLSPGECKKLMGFPDNFIFPVSDSQAYKQLGNAVVPELIEKIIKKLLDDLTKEMIK